jgi:hypothetical protein
VIPVGSYLLFDQIRVDFTMLADIQEQKFLTVDWGILRSKNAGACAFSG